MDRWATQLFGTSLSSQLHQGSLNQATTLPIGHLLHLRPMLCGEIFFKQEFLKTANETDPIAAFVNDSWFLPYYQDILAAFVCMKARRFKKAIIYVSFSRWNLFIP